MKLVIRPFDSPKLHSLSLYLFIASIFQFFSYSLSFSPRPIGQIFLGLIFLCYTFFILVPNIATTVAKLRQLLILDCYWDLFFIFFCLILCIFLHHTLCSSSCMSSRSPIVPNVMIFVSGLVISIDTLSQMICPITSPLAFVPTSATFLIAQPVSTNISLSVHIMGIFWSCTQSDAF